MKYTFVLFVAIGVVGCKSSPTSTDNPQQSGVIQPLAVGNYWHYSFTWHGPFGDTLQSLETTERIARDTLIGVETWYAMTYEGNDPGHFFTNRSDGLYGLDVKSYDPSILPYRPYPASVGKSIVYRFGVAGYSYFDSLYLKALNVPITTPAGSFSCLQYTDIMVINGDSSYREHYYAPNIGHIRTDIYQEDFIRYIHEVRELQDYKLN